MAVRKTKAGLRLKRWFKEDWRTPRGKKDYKGGENTFRPTKRISKDTPITWSELTPAEKRRAQKEKILKVELVDIKEKRKRKLLKRIWWYNTIRLVMARNSLAGKRTGKSKTAKFYAKNPKSKAKKKSYDKKYHSTTEKKKLPRIAK